MDMADDYPPPPTLPPGRKKLALQSREGYLKMYKAYCAQPSPANPAVCSNESLKKVYDNMAKSIQQSAKAA